MKSKRFVTILIAVALVAMMSFSLAGCLKIGMRMDYIEKRLKDAGANVEYVRTSPMTAEGGESYYIENILVSTMQVPDSPDDGAETHEDKLYVFVCGNSETANWVKEKCKAYKNADEHSEECANWNVYDFEDTVMFGHYKILSIARNY